MSSKGRGSMWVPDQVSDADPQTWALRVENDPSGSFPTSGRVPDPFGVKTSLEG